MRHILAGLVLSSTLVARVWAGQPAHIYGVNLGSWLVLEPWLLPQEWLDMGGERCEVCSTCIASEASFAKAYPDTVDTKFATHWDTWFTQDDVNTLKAAGINTVRIPLGYWIVERLVDRPQESFPRGGLKYLRRGLSWLKDAGIQVILDHHALPGAQVTGQMFTGDCATEAKFYTPYNYHRALVWTAVMTGLSHLDPVFESVFAIEAVNNPISDATKTPDYGTFQKNFVQMIRAIELTLGIPVTSSNFPASVSPSVSNNFTAALIATTSAPMFSKEVQVALLEAIPILLEIGEAFGLPNILEASPPMRSCDPLVANFMDVNWQYNNPSNPADVAIGPQAYDSHLIYAHGEIAAADPTSYMISICNLNRIQDDAAVGNSPLWIGEWVLATEFKPTDAFMRQFGDAQKLAYSKSAGWIYWNFKIEVSKLAKSSDLVRQWSYIDGLRFDLLTQDPAALHDPNVCVPYMNSTIN